MYDQLNLAYLVYRSQSGKLRVEAQAVVANFNTARSWDIVRKHSDVEFFEATAEANDHRERKRNECLQTAHGTRTISMARLQVLGTGTFEEAKDLLQKDTVGDVAAQQIYDSDDIVREHVADLCERALRLRLICSSSPMSRPLKTSCPTLQRLWAI